MQQDDSQRQALQAGVKRQSAIAAAAEVDQQKKRATVQMQAETTGGTPKDATASALSQNGDRVSFAIKVPDSQHDLSDDETVATSAQAYNERLK